MALDEREQPNSDVRDRPVRLRRTMRIADLPGGGKRALPNLFRSRGVELADGSDDLSAISELHGDRLIETGRRTYAKAV